MSKIHFAENVCVVIKVLVFFPLWQQHFLHFEIKWRGFSSVVGYNGRGFPPLWDTVEVFLHCKM